MSDSPLTPDQRDALARLERVHGPGWKSVLRVRWMMASAEPALHRLRNTHGPAWLAHTKLEAQARLDFTAYADPVLAVPCPVCRRPPGAWVASGRAATGPTSSTWPTRRRGRRGLHRAARG